MILRPYISSQVGLVFLWGAVLGVITQWFLNMEIGRNTLATGETALTGFSRLWKHSGLVFAIMTYFANLWPGWATSSATMVTGQFPDLEFALMLGAIAYAGAGGGQNLCQSNWIRDKQFGMGAYVPRLVSPITGQDEAASATGYVFAPTQGNLARCWPASPSPSCCSSSPPA
ncbi:Nramp family divalent metal transporter [Actinopolymorpha alba]|uniref:Nramp family divalent metal transporter n=1 Tax=Actinopolymorpha alba TaxID=533267 RepID=UPI0003A007D0|nr:Nramp family divalent metal transporter [Actinopolymorpha alba]